MSAPRLDWKSAAVRQATLTVGLQGDRPKGWKASFERTVRLLGGGDWGQVKLKSDTVRVSDIGPGSEDRLRHFLESAVQQANADHQDSPEHEDEGTGAGAEAVDDADKQMTQSFQSFAGEE